MTLPTCGSRHQCADGGVAGCSQPQGHYGRHLCATCLKFFGGGEAIDPAKPVVAPPAGETGTQGKSPQADRAPRVAEQASCAHCKKGDAEGWPWKRCKHCTYQLCPNCTPETCPYVTGTCAHCTNKLTTEMSKGRCEYCGNLLCSSCKDKTGCFNPQVKCGHCGWGVKLGEAVTCSCGVSSHPQCRRECEAGGGRYNLTSDTGSAEKPGQVQAHDQPKISADGPFKCAHCPRPLEHSVRECPLCHFKLCDSCPATNCPKYYGTCAHCATHFSWDGAKGTCECCGYLICLKCDSSRCTNPKLRCNHCNGPMRMSGYNICKYCGHGICGNCSPEQCPKPKMVCPHCHRPLAEYSLCYCGSEAHKDCMYLCPYKDHPRI
jgi:hypothetical protein